MKGQKPVPIQRQIAEGDRSKRGVHKLDQLLERQIKAPKGLPACPRHLRGRARAMWNLWKQELEAMGLDARCDGAMLEGACVTYARAVEADLFVAKRGAVIEEPIIGKDGNLLGYRSKAHPAVAIGNEAWRICRSLCSEFGLSPVSRTRLALDEKDLPSDEEELAKLFAAPRPLRNASGSVRFGVPLNKNKL